MTVIYAVILFVMLIFPHELGHFTVAKAVGVRVNEFAFGMGPAIFQRQKGETLYSIRLIPIGGYCAMEGENEESESSRAFNNKPVWAKISVLLAGSAMNVLIAILAMTLVMGYIGTATTTIDEVQTGTPAYEAGLLSEDKVLSVNGTPIEKWNDIAAAIGSGEDRLSITVERNGEEETFEMTPEKTEDGRYIIGVTSKVSHNALTAVSNGAKGTWSMTKGMFSALAQLVSGEVSTDELSGPVGIVSLVSETKNYGMIYFGYLVALISLNLALMNMLPLPALDGGRIIFVIIRKITGKMISDNLEGKIHGAGMILLFGFMIFVTWNDITRLFTS
ncbi:RIP metalloprotease RseP [Anaerovoracaceae bacterium 41-7]|jgi:regulator of sigma E protease|uniref:RIP metalloprotease RseP n=1 Tax=Senimuribacter intestinalis TaxID=2941507 RepID=UPI00203FEFF0|nr:RIP metalloprotease RseP [Senimuribacter intestinalis]MCI9477029.1 RIP metalloprotease RseP [Emergencia sp.]MCI9638904.1 RIP metalloprotease RseP [Emergencia sp.]